MGEEVEKICDFVSKKKRGSNIMWWRLKVSGKEAYLKLPCLQISLQYNLITKES